MTSPRTLLPLVAAALLVACRADAPATPRRVGDLRVIAAPADSAVVGSSAGTVTVRVLDTDAGAYPGVPVAFTVVDGAGSVSAPTAVTDANGDARVRWTIGTTPGDNRLLATAGENVTASMTTVGVAAPAARVEFAAGTMIRFLAGDSTWIASASVSDAYGNVLPDSVTWRSRDTTLVAVRVTSASTMRAAVRRRPGQTWLVARSGAARDSVHAIVFDSTSRSCDFVATARALAAGEVVAVNGTACIATTDAHAEFVLVEHYSTAAGDALTPLEATSLGVVPVDSAFPSVPAAAAPAPGAGASFEGDLRASERREMPAFAASAREWYRERGALPAARKTPAIGDLIQLNTNHDTFCINPTPRTGRIVAITDGAVVVADTMNPAGGFSDDEYRAFGVAVDTLVTPLDTAAFGAPTDIDGNGRVVVFFTSAVNALTPPGSPGGVILGFFYSRDLLPKTGVLGVCSGSNEGEMFYVLVPDSAGMVNGNVRTRDYVRRNAMGVLVHEYQHLINASRRLYVTHAPQATEEYWLNEGLSHIAEELAFYRESGLAPRQDIGAGQLAPGTATRAAFDLYQANNVARYRAYLRQPDVHSPFEPREALEMRGAVWAFLRYIADHARPDDGDFWRQLVDSRTTGVANLDAVLAPTGRSTLGMLADWSVSVVADDHPSSTDAQFQQPSWNFASAMSVLPPNLSWTLDPRRMSDAGLFDSRLLGGGSDYLRFAVDRGRPALITVTGFRGSPLPAGLRFSIVRIE